MSDHAEHRIGSLWVGILVLAVALAAGWGLGKLLRQGDDREPEPLTLVRPAMGTIVEIKLRRETEFSRETQRLGQAAEAAFAEIARVDSLFSTHLPPPVSMTADEQRAEQERLLAVGLEVMRESGGAFDPRMRPLMELWGFESGEPHVPRPEALRREVARLITAGDPRSPSDLLAAPELLHYGAWAKGYAVDRAIAVLREQGVTEALVNAGGEIRCLGLGWRVGVQHPRLRGELLARLQPGRMAVATSGDYEQFFEQDGVRYHHLLDPRSGEPARGCQSVTVIAPTCARADALATAVFVLGTKNGLNLLEMLGEVEGLVVDAAGDLHRTSGLDRYLLED